MEYHDEAGATIDPSTGKVTPPEKPIDFGSERTGLEQFGEGLALFANSATMGAVPAITGLVSSEAKNDMLNYLDQGRSDLGGWGTAIELAGGLVTPMPGGALAASAKGASTLAKLGRAVGRSALTGGVTSAIQYAGDTRNADYSLKDHAKAALMGAGVAGTMGAAGNLIGQQLATRAKSSRFSAGGGSAGTIKKLGRSSGDASLDAVAQKANKVAANAEKRGWTGQFGQTIDDSVIKANKAVDIAEAKIERIMAVHGNKPVMTTGDFKNEVMEHVFNAHEYKGNLTASTENALFKKLNAELDNILGWNKKTKAFDIPEASARDMQVWKKKIGELAYGMSGEKSPADNIFEKMIVQAKTKISEMETKAVASFDPKAAKQLAAAKRMYHEGLLWRNMGLASQVSEAGLLEHLMGRGMRSIPDTYVVGEMLRKLGIPGGPIINQGIAGTLGRGRIPNALLAVNRKAQNIGSRVGGLKGVFSPHPIRPGRAGQLAARNTYGLAIQPDEEYSYD